MEVNNLKISAGYLRVRVSTEFEISPYDFRFPVWIIWLVQILEDVLEAIWMSFSVAFAVTVLLYVHERISKFELGY